MLSEIPRFYAAKRHGVVLLFLGVLYAVLGLVFIRLATDGHVWFTSLPVPHALGTLGSAFWIAAAGFLSAACISLARNSLITAETPAAPQSVAVWPESQTGWRKFYGRAHKATQQIRYRLPKTVMLAAWPQSLSAALFGAFAAAGIVMLWRQPAGPTDTVLIQQIFGAALIGLAFPLLLLERFYATLSAERLPEAPQLNRLLRVPLTACLGLAATALLSSAGLSWAKYIHTLVMLLIFAVGIELVLRGAVMFFVPYPLLENRRAVADSSIARVFLRLSVPNFRTLNSNVRNTLGIDLSRSWALAFVRQAALPVLAVLGIFSWCITGVTGLAANQRGIYERLGAPVSVLGPGVHLHLPWPFGSVRTAENGVIHLLPIEFVLPGSEAEADHHSSIPVGAEDTPPEEADRLWSDDHPFEGSYLIAHEVDGKQSFQLVDVDMTVIYRIGMSDEAVRNATYGIASADDLIQAISGQLITRYFARHTLLSVIGSNRQAFTDEFKNDLQAELDKASSGIEAMSVSIEAVHPPPGAAGAYHRVQAAGIRANTEIYTSRGNATRLLSEARLTADAEHNASLAKADELIATAKTESALFEADRQAYGLAGRGFLLERWLGNLAKALDKSVPVILVDHRLQGADAPTVDLRGQRLNGPATGQGTQGGTGATDPYGAGAQNVPGSQNSGGDNHVE